MESYFEHGERGLIMGRFGSSYERCGIMSRIGSSHVWYNEKIEFLSGFFCWQICKT